MNSESELQCDAGGHPAGGLANCRRLYKLAMGADDRGIQITPPVNNLNADNQFFELE
jgi:hypothetical protein